MELVLKIDGQEKKYVSPPPKFAVMLKTSELFKAMEKGEFLRDDATDEDSYVDMLKLRDYIVMVFGNQFTTEEFDNGFEAEDTSDFFSLARLLMQEVLVNPKKLELLEKQMLEIQKTTLESSTTQS